MLTRVRLSPTLSWEMEKNLCLGNSRIVVSILGKGKILLKYTFGKTLILNDVLHVPSVWVNLIFGALPRKTSVKISCEFDKIVMTVSNMYIGDNYCNQGLFILSVSQTINENASSSA